MSMIGVLVPIALMICIILFKKLPKIGGNIHAALIIAGLSALLLNGIFNPLTWLSAWVNGIDRIAWVMMLSIFGTIYAETQISMGTMDTVLNLSRATFGKSPKGLLVAIMLSLALAGSLLGDAIAVSTVVGVLIIKPLYDMGLKPEEISATLVMGALLGSVCPPISGAIFQASGLVGVNTDAASMYAYITVGIAIAFSCIYAAFAFVKIKSLPADLIPKETPWQIFRTRWLTLLPMGALILIVILRSGPWKIDIIATIFAPFVSFISKIPILQGLSNIILLAVFTVTLLSFLSPKVRKRGARDIIKTGVKNVLPCTGVQLAAGFMLGGFYAAGVIETIEKFAMSLNIHLLKLGGSLAMTLVAMMTGSQTTAQSAIFSFFGPALVNSGLDPAKVAAAGAQIATAGQAMPPADLCTFVVAGLVGGILGVKVDCVKSMIRSFPGFFVLLLGGMALLFI